MDHQAVLNRSPMPPDGAAGTLTAIRPDMGGTAARREWSASSR
jgi:hypothetical protein